MKLSYRIGYHRYATDQAFAEHLAFIKANLDCIDEVALFVEFAHHGYWPLEMIRDSSALLRRRLADYRALGIRSAGLNILCTIGHLEEAWDVLPKPTVPCMIGKDGRQSHSCLCPASAAFREYICEKYRILAACQPDFIWVDDDFRINHHGVAGPCFCQECLRQFNQRNHSTFTRESLLAALDQSQDTAAAWQTFQGNLYTTLAQDLRQAVHSVNPKIELGLMTGLVSSRNPEWFTALGAVRGRPGGGFYQDTVPMEAMRKGLETAVQLANYPASVRDRQYEHEDFPYQQLGKSLCMAMLEDCVNLVWGCNGIAFNSMFRHDNPRLLASIRHNQAAWREVTRLNTGMESAGVWCNDRDVAFRLQEIGLPITFQPETAAAAVITGSPPLPQEEWCRILSRAAFIDAPTLIGLQQLGLADLCGATVEKCWPNGTLEAFTDHLLNGPYAGWRRDVFVSFRPQFCSDAYTLKMAPGTESLCELQNVLQQPLGSAMTACSNNLGGRVVVSGYFFPHFLLFSEKRQQLLNVFDWLTQPRLPRIDLNHKIMPILRRRGSDFLLFLLNASFDASGEFTVQLRQTVTALEQILPDGSRAELPCRQADSGSIVTCPSLPPWQYCLLTNVPAEK